MRTLIALLMVVGGFLLQAVSYVYLAAPLGVSTSPVYSNPRVPFAAALFILGVMIVFLAAAVYELIPEKEAGETTRLGRAGRPSWPGRLGGPGR